MKCRANESVAGDLQETYRRPRCHVRLATARVVCSVGVCVNMNEVWRSQSIAESRGPGGNCSLTASVAVRSQESGAHDRMDTTYMIHMDMEPRPYGFNNYGFMDTSDGHGHRIGPPSHIHTTSGSSRQNG